MKLIFEQSPWIILLCFLAGGVYALILYFKDSLYDKRKRITLAVLRFLVVSIIVFLLAGPFIRLFHNFTERPTWVIAIDNSVSIPDVVKSQELEPVLKELDKINGVLKDRDFDTQVRTLNESSVESPVNIKFNRNQTNLDQLLKGIQTDFEGRNLAGVILVTDGIYNQGTSPLYSGYSFDIHTVGLGDTIPQKDIQLKTLYHNKIAYQSNKFPLIAEISNYGFAGSSVIVDLYQNNQKIDSKTLLLNSSEGLSNVEFIVEAKSKGMQHYKVVSTALKGEFSLKNNSLDAYIDIVEGKDKILIVAFTPHPDIKAIVSALENNQNYELHTFIPGLNQYKDDKYDLVIFHQLPDVNNSGYSMIDKFTREGTPVWFILGAQTNFSQFNKLGKVMRVNSGIDDKDYVTPVYSNDFNGFIFEQEKQSVLKDFPPLQVAYGRFDLNNGSQVILYQKIGNLSTSKPLLAVQSIEGRESAVLPGEGLWQWRLHEFSKTGRHDVFDEFVNKLVQYLSTKEDKRKFKVYPVKNEFIDSEQIVFETEVYNDIYEKIYGQQISLEVTDENGKNFKYSYTTAENNTRYYLSGLSQGVYKYSASSVINGKNERVSGQFTVKELQVESSVLTANHDLLRTLSLRTGGKFFLPADISNLEEVIKNAPGKSVIYSEEEYLPVISLKWLFFLILILVTAEWFARKYWGAY